MGSKVCIATAVVLAAGLLVPAAAEPASVMLEKGLYAEQTAGQLDEAIGIYQKILADAQAERKFVAQAQYQLAGCYLKKGDKAHAVEAFGKLIASYGDQKELAGKAREELARLMPPSSQPRQFGPVVEAFLPHRADGRKTEMLDLDTGKRATKDDFGANDRETHEWIRQNGLDLMGISSPKEKGVLSADMAALPVSPKSWDSLTPQQLVGNKMLAQMEPNKIAILGADLKEAPPTYLFRTREGGLGILQILSYSDAPAGVTIRYKMLAQGTMPHPAVAAASDFVKALAAGQFEDAYKRTSPDYARDHKGGLERLAQMADLSGVQIAQALAATDDACIVTNAFPPKAGGKPVAIGLGLRKFGTAWLVRDIDALPNEQAEAEFVAGFRKAFPQAAAVAASAPSQADKMKAEALNAEGWRLFGQRKMAEAEGQFQQAVTADPASANAFNGLGWSQFHQGKTQTAIDSFKRCLAIDPKAPAAMNGLGWIAKGQGNTDEAIGYWKQAVEAAPSATAAWNGLAVTYTELAQFDKAAECYQSWLKVEPGSAVATAGLKNLQAAKEAAAAKKAPASRPVTGQ